MNKSLTFRELMGICDERFSGDTLMEVAQKGMQHMQSDDGHKEHMAGYANNTEKDRKQWFEKMQLVFDAKPEDD